MCYKDRALIEKILLSKYELLKETIILSKHLIIKVKGESMLPTLIEGEKVIIDPIFKESDLQIGDIILFYDFEYDLVLHRLICKDYNKFILKGDNGDIVDIIEFKNIIGKVNNNINLKDLGQPDDQQYIKRIDDYSIVVNINSGELISFNLYK